MAPDAKLFVKALAVNGMPRDPVNMACFGLNTWRAGPGWIYVDRLSRYSSAKCEKGARPSSEFCCEFSKCHSCCFP
jgi:hypothetical protein